MPTKTETKIIGSNEFKAGRIYTLRYASTVDMVGKREFAAHLLTPTIEKCASHIAANGAMTAKKINPLHGCAITVKRKSIVQAAGEKTWGNLQRRKNPEWMPSMDAVQWWSPLASNQCIVEHNKNANLYLRGIPKGVMEEAYFVDGELATPEQVELIRAFKEGKSDREQEFILLDLANLENVENETGEDE